MIQEAIGRIEAMERHLELLLEAERAGETPDARALEALTAYYQGGLWLRDYELDERGLLPTTLKRGVLGQDTVYDLLERLRDRTN